MGEPEDPTTQPLTQLPQQRPPPPSVPASQPPPPTGYAYGYGNSPYPGHGYSPYTPLTNSNAVISLVLGLLAWTGCPFTAIGGVILGRRARDEIADSGGIQSGEGIAKAGVIISWCAIGFYGLAMLLALVVVVTALIIGIATT